MTTRTTNTTTTTHVKRLAEPIGQARENGPHLVDLRAFVAACEGIPDETLVRIHNGHLGESGRMTVTIELHHRVTGDSDCTA